jgi:hypothetical protein
MLTMNNISYTSAELERIVLWAAEFVEGPLDLGAFYIPDGETAVNKIESATCDAALTDNELSLFVGWFDRFTGKGGPLTDEDRSAARKTLEAWERIQPPADDRTRRLMDLAGKGRH